MRFNSKLVVPLVSLLLVAACTKSSPQPVDLPSSRDAAPKTAAAEPVIDAIDDSADIDLKIVDLEQLRDHIASRDGQYVLVDLWALW